VLAIHGLGGSGRYWQGLADRVGDRVRVIAPDLAGFGSSDKPDIEYDRAGHLADLSACAGDETNLAVVGHSLGALLAALWAADRDGVVPALALAAPPFPDGAGPDYRRLGGPPGSLAARAAVRTARAALPLVSYPVGLARGYPRQVVRDFTRQALPARGRTMWSLLSDPTVAEDLDDVGALDGSCPALVVHAEDDRTVPIGAHARWTALLPHADAQVLASGGHQFLLRRAFEPVAGWLQERARA
jgi:pimeloyl-ACP methyl ester carboxylesterase